MMKYLRTFLLVLLWTGVASAHPGHGPGALFHDLTQHDFGVLPWLVLGVALCLSAVLMYYQPKRPGWSVAVAGFGGLAVLVLLAL